MHAIWFDRYGSPDELTLKDVEVPQPADDEVLVEVHAASVNLSDWEILHGEPLYSRIWGVFSPRFHVLGSDLAGRVLAVGRSVTLFHEGDAVFGDSMGSFGGFAERACAKEKHLFKMPEGISFAQAAALPQASAIAMQGIEKSQLRSGEKLLINGAGGGSGSFTIQLAKRLGAHVTAVDNGEKLEFMQSLGADHVIDYRQEDCTANLGAYDVILDAVGGHSFFDFRRALKPGGRYLVAGGPMSLVLQSVFVGPLLGAVGKKQMGLLAVQQNGGVEEMARLVAEGAISVAIDRTFPLAETPAAFRYLGEGHARGKVVVSREL